MAIRGYEIDYVMRGAAGDTPVPPTWLYNHHYKFCLNNEECFSEGNGGESRASFHGYPRGAAQVVYSPKSVRLVVMAVDTRLVRDGNASSTRTREMDAVTTQLAAAVPPWERLISCPCTSRFSVHEGARAAGDHVFRENCPPLLSRPPSNPSCRAATYVGGRLCCKHGAVLLDKHVTQPAHEMTTYLKLRFYYESYTATAHTQCTRSHLHSPHSSHCWRCTACAAGTLPPRPPVLPRRTRTSYASPSSRNEHTSNTMSCRAPLAHRESCARTPSTTIST
jgi:hypothetical protein